MHYSSRNLENIGKLAPKTRAAATELHNFAEKNGIEILIYETMRTEKRQQELVVSGKSKTYRSYHLVGQALDFVPSNGKDVFWGGFNNPKIKKFIAQAKKIGFEWGGDWTTFIDKYHLQFPYNGYGTDVFYSETPAPAPAPAPAPGEKNNNSIVDYLKNLGIDSSFKNRKNIASQKGIFGYTGTPEQNIRLLNLLRNKNTLVPKPTLKKGGRGDQVKLLQILLGGLNADGIFGSKTESSLKNWQARHGLSADGIYGVKTQTKFRSVY